MAIHLPKRSQFHLDNELVQTKCNNITMEILTCQNDKIVDYMAMNVFAIKVAWNNIICEFYWFSTSCPFPTLHFLSSGPSERNGPSLLDRVTHPVHQQWMAVLGRPCVQPSSVKRRIGRWRGRLRTVSVWRIITQLAICCAASAASLWRVNGSWLAGLRRRWTRAGLSNRKWMCRPELNQSCTCGPNGCPLINCSSES